MGSHRLVAAALVSVALVGVAACYDFGAAVETCKQSGHCEVDDAGNVIETDGGTDAGEDAGGVIDGGFDAGLDAGDDGGTQPCTTYTMGGLVQLGAWEWENPLPASNNLSAVSGVPGTVWVAGDDGTLLKIHKCVITQFKPPAGKEKDFHDVLVRRAEELYVVGDVNASFQIRGGVATSLVVDGITMGANLRTVGRSGDFVAFALNYPAPTPLAVSQDILDGGWTADWSAGPGGDTVTSIDGLGAHWWAIGGDGGLFSSTKLQPAAGDWSPEPSGAPGVLRDVWTDKGDQYAYVVGDDGFIGSNRSGKAQPETGPGGTTKLFSISGAEHPTDPGQMALLVGGEKGRLFARNGTDPTVAWTPLKDKDGLPITNADFHSVWVRPYDDTAAGGHEMWAVGSAGVLATNAMGDWVDLRDVMTKTGLADFAGIDGAGDTVFAINKSRLFTRGAMKVWQPVQKQPQLNANQTLEGLAVISANQVFVVGKYGTFLEYDGSNWKTFSIDSATGGNPYGPGDPTIHLLAISGTQAGTKAAWAVGYKSGGTDVPFAARWDGSTNKWKEIDLTTAALTGQLVHVSAKNDLEAWAVTPAAAVDLHKPTTTFIGTAYVFASMPKLQSVFAEGTSTNVYVAGDGFIGKLITTATPTIQPAKTPGGTGVDSEIYYDATRASSDLLFVGGGGRAYRIAEVMDGGVEATAIAPATKNILRGIYWSPASGDVWVVGDSATVLRKIK